MKRIALLGFLLLGGCGLQPLYSGGSHGEVAQTLSGIEVGPIGGQQGWLMRNTLVDRLGATGHSQARFRLDVALDDQITGFGIRTNNTVSRERRTLRAHYSLVDLATNKVVLDTSAQSDAGIDVVTSEYAVIAAEQTALENITNELADQIITRVAIYARRHPPVR